MHFEEYVQSKRLIISLLIKCDEHSPIENRQNETRGRVGRVGRWLSHCQGLVQRYRCHSLGLLALQNIRNGFDPGWEVVVFPSNRDGHGFYWKDYLHMDPTIHDTRKEGSSLPT